MHSMTTHYMRFYRIRVRNWVQRGGSVKREVQKISERLDVVLEALGLRPVQEPEAGEMPVAPSSTLALPLATPPIRSPLGACDGHRPRVGGTVHRDLNAYPVPSNQHDEVRSQTISTSVCIFMALSLPEACIKRLPTSLPHIATNWDRETLTTGRRPYRRP